MAKRQPPEHDSDYDGAWKEALRKYFRAFMQMYFPAVYGHIDWAAELEWYDKELSQVLGQPGSRNRTVDVLVKVRLLSGDEQWILVHLEIQTSFEPDFAERIGLYNAGLYWSFRQRVATLVILADLNRHWLPQEDEFRLADFHSRLEFPICKLVEHLETDWRDDHSLPVLLARAQVAALRTASDPEGRFRAKWQLVRGLYELGYNAEQVRELFRLIDWMMHLREDLSKRFRIDLDQLEEELGMSYVTSVERLAKAEGKAEGQREALSSLLEAKFGRLSPDVAQRIRQTDSVEKLSSLLLQVLTIDSVEQLNW